MVHMCEENIDVSPILNEHVIGGSRIYPTQVQNPI